jgi:hypothetical protein
VVKICLCPVFHRKVRQILVVVVVGEIGDATEAVFFGGDAGEDTIICRRLCPRSPQPVPPKPTYMLFANVVLPAPVPPAMPIMNGFVFASLLAAMAALSSWVLCFVVGTILTTYHVGTLLGSAETKPNTNHKKTP